ncbi:hypothetical protein ES703_123892 [subsurface metagenome]
MAGTYSEISIIAPSSAQAGETVNVEARIRNLCDFAINLTATMGRVNGEVLRFGAIHKVVGAGETESWYDSFIMPDRGIVVSVESWYLATDEAWYSDDRAEIAIALEVVAPPVAGTITRKELDYQNIWQALPLYDIPVDTRTRVRITGRNDMETNQKMGIYWFISDPEGYAVQEYTDWETFWTGPGLEQGFVGSGFDLSKVGKYTIWVELLMNPDNPEIVDQYIGDLCTVEAAVPEPLFRGFALAEYTRR